MDEIERVYRLLFDDLRKYVSILSQQFFEDGYRPDVIVSIRRGGDTITRILSDKVNIKNIFSITCENYSDVGVRMKEPCITKGIDKKYIEEKNVLLVDDTADSGKSIKKCYEYISSMNPKELNTSTILYKEKSIFKPSLHAGIQDPKTWIIFPGEEDETIRGLLKRGKEELLYGAGFSELDIIEVLIQDHQNRILDALNYKGLWKNKQLMLPQESL